MTNLLQQRTQLSTEKLEKNIITILQMMDHNQWNTAHAHINSVRKQHPTKMKVKCLSLLMEQFTKSSQNKDNIY